MSRKKERRPDEPRYFKINAERGYGNDTHEVIGIKGSKVGNHREFELRNTSTQEHLTIYEAHTNVPFDLRRRTIEEKRQEAMKIGRGKRHKGKVP